MLGEVKVWYMTEEERQAYIKKHPIVQMDKPKGHSFGNIYADYKWRPEKSVPASVKARKSQQK